MSDPLLTFLKYIFLALLYLFFLRVLRAVWVELREPKAAPTPVADVTAPAAVGTPPLGRRETRRARKESARQPGRLVVVDPADLQGQDFALSEELTLGRAGGCGVALPDDTYVSQIHARVFRRDGQVWVEDLGSTNGTFLNGAKLASPTPVHRGDRLQVGHTTLEVST